MISSNSTWRAAARSEIVPVARRVGFKQWLLWPFTRAEWQTSAWLFPADSKTRVDVSREIARVAFVQVVLRKLGRGSRAVTGRLVRAPRKGSVVVIEFSDGMHEYVTTPVKRVLRLAARDVFYIETVNSRYRLEVRDRERALEDASSG